MSGSDGPDPVIGSGAGLGGGSFGGDDSCSTLSLRAGVENPDPTVNWVVGQRFAVALEAGEPFIITLNDGSGEAVGAVRPLPRLLRCLQANFEYEAVVVHVNGGDIEVQVDPAA